MRNSFIRETISTFLTLDVGLIFVFDQQKSGLIHTILFVELV